MNKTVGNVSLLLGALVAGIAGIVCLVGLWNILGDRGLSADAHGTTGYTTDSDVLLGIGGLFLLLVAVVLLVVGIVRMSRTKQTKK